MAFARFEFGKLSGGLTALTALVCAFWILTAFLPDERTRPLGQDMPVIVNPLPGGHAAFERLYAAHAPRISMEEGSRRGSATVREKPIQFEIVLDPALPREGPRILEISNLRASKMRVWLLSSMPDGIAGDESRSELTGRMHKRGLAIEMPPSAHDEGSRIIGIADPHRLARATATLWEPDAYRASSVLFDRQGAGLIGAFLIMSLFSAVLAAINRDFAFFVFSGWLITTLWTIGWTAGWDADWLGIELSTHASNSIIRTVLASQALLTLLLFRTLFSTSLGPALSRVFSVLTLACTALVLAGPFLASTTFLPIFWALAGTGMLFLATQTIRSMIVAPSPVSCWYAFSWACFFSGPLTEIALSAGIIRSAPVWINMPSGGLAAALLAAVALAERIRVERSRRVKAQAEAIAAAEALTTHYRSMPIGLLSIDADGFIETFNPALAAMFGLEPQQQLNSGRRQRIIDLPIGKDLRSHIERLRAGEASALRDLRLQSADGSWFQVDLKLRGDLVEGAIQDVSARAKAEATISRMVDHDVLTKALNQRGLNDAVERALTLIGKGVPCTMIDVDIDRFKTLNDLYGHMVGDEVLKSVAHRIGTRLPRDDALARVGDSYKIVLYDCDAAGGLEVANGLHAEIAGKTFEVAGRVLTLSASLGVLAMDASMTVADAIASASHACSDAKSGGRNRIVQVARKDLALHGYLEELRVQASLKDRLDTQRFFLEMQPIVSLRSAFERLNYEVLVRMRGEDGSVVPPGKFIPAAERNGQMSLIDRWVLTRTLQWLGDHPEHTARLDYATINMSGASLNDARFVDNAFAIMSEFPGLTNKLCFEITETVALTDRLATSRFASRVHSMGGKIALDDFGAGYTSFTYLREIEADIIKIDGSFVRDIGHNPANHAITRMISELTHELGKVCVAEWAEDPAIIATLIELNVDFGQGYALGRPMDPLRLSQATSCGDLVPDANLRRLLLEGSTGAMATGKNERARRAPRPREASAI